jgi:hypothetical protein
MADAGIVYEAQMLERLEPILSLARRRLGSDRTALAEATAQPTTLERALELLDASQSRNIASPNE